MLGWIGPLQNPFLRGSKKCPDLHWNRAVHRLRGVKAGYVRQRTDAHAHIAYVRTATRCVRKSVQVSGFSQTIKRNSDEVFNSVFSCTDGVCVERMRQTDYRDACGGGCGSRARRPDRCHRFDRNDWISRWYRSNRIHRGYRSDRVHREYRRNRIHGRHRCARSARQNWWRHRGSRSGFASQALSPVTWGRAGTAAVQSSHLPPVGAVVPDGLRRHPVRRPVICVRRRRAGTRRWRSPRR